MSKRVAVIGAGAGGLAAIKSCIEEDLDVVCYEKTNNWGGLWRYREENINGVASVMKTTITNTSKEMTCFSDFPPPNNFPNYMHHKVLLEYLGMYGEYFHIFDHIKYLHEVLHMKQSEESGKWILTIKESTGNVFESLFDYVMVCVGINGYPNIPVFKGFDLFTGKVLHTWNLKSMRVYEDMKVLVVGIGNSGTDAAVDLSNICSKVYLSTRGGTWISSRIGPRGEPGDTTFVRRSLETLKNMVPEKIFLSLAEKKLDGAIDHELYGVKSKYRIFSNQITVNDALPNKIITGRIIIKGDVKEFTERGVIFQGESEITEVDLVILGTGYIFTFPFLSPEIININSNHVQLYKNVFLPDNQKSTIAFIGVINVLGSSIPILEMQSRWAVRVFTKKVKLPDDSVMIKNIESKFKMAAKTHGNPNRVFWISYMDEIASFIDCKPDLLSLALYDPKLFFTCFTGPCVPYQYRLNGPHSWTGARDAILNCQKRIRDSFRFKTKEEKTNHVFITILKPLIVFIVAYIFLWLYQVVYKS